MNDTKLIDSLRAILGEDRVMTDAAQRELLSGDFYSQGKTCAAVIRPADAGMVATATRTVTDAGYALIARGGGMTYTGGYTPDSSATVIVDTSDLQGIVNFDPANMVVTVRAGTTWETLYDFLAPHGLRLPFFGTFSGRRATVGGGLSNGAVFFGTARYGGAAEQVLGLEVVCADGRILRTGQAAFRRGKPFYRNHGPDLTGMFLHDSGALGIKTEATFRLIKMPAYTDYLSYAFPDALSAAAALSEIARSGAAEEAYVFDPESTRKNMEGSTLGNDVRRLGRIVATQGGLLAGLRAGLRVIVAGKRLVPDNAYSLHLACAGRSRAAVDGDLNLCSQLLDAQGGTQIPNSIPMAVRASPFDNLNSALGPAGERWAALNAKVPHADVAGVIEGFNNLLQRHQVRMQELKITTSTLFIAMEASSFSFEPVFHWPDDWLPMHRHIPDPAYLARLHEPAPNPEAAALVATLREETMALFSELGAASNQIGRSYPYFERLEPATADLLLDLKTRLDPRGLMNPGVLGLSPGKPIPGD